MKKVAAIFSLMMGFMMFGTWAYLLLLDKFPGIKTVPLETGYLLVAEALTSFALIASGYGMLSQRKWGQPLALVALGELIYCTVRYAGELGQTGSLAGLAFFTAVPIFGIAFALYLLLMENRRKTAV